MSNRNSIVVILVTAPDGQVAQQLATKLVGERLVACANVLPGIQSVYWWEGEVQNSSEVLMLMKARKQDVDAVTERVRALHPYAVPEVIATDVVSGLEAYLNWVVAETERG